MVQAVAEVMGLDSSDVLFAPSPLAHASGLQYGWRLAIALGTTLLLLDKWNPEEAAELLERYRGTWALGATPFLYDLSKLPDDQRRRLASLREPWIVASSTRVKHLLISALPGYARSDLEDVGSLGVR
jgi:acyl-CoA synthetase (AMP-forming)/AMP-acid ligase II